MMASLFASAPPFVSPSRPAAARSNYYAFLSSQAPPPPNQTAATPPAQHELSAAAAAAANHSAQPPNVVAGGQSCSTSVEPKPTITTAVDSTDWIASTLTRRFGIGAGLAWVAFLAVGVVSEQIKTRLEVSQQAANTRVVEEQEEVILPSGIRYTDLRVGGGASPRSGDLVVMKLKGSVQGSGETFVDTFEEGERRRALALVMGSRPYSKGVCEGIEYVLGSMKAGGIRRAVIPPSLAFGEEGADFGYGDAGIHHIPPFATLEYLVQIDTVSTAPS
ncbi:peptidyl-prolyl cis-trans isomerase FKBP17-2, chloroplastic [Andrographis paniculata]|uniref:peptidyl-prolyl cis-trans isomerase FKBP17-2, chloroplastic n=1 Tax=Andrographis paniculata TaxID=175694 RepID=UPI0021E75470|nr:peptidyl-prolyl cis-trans isomerase FKBP17-2, chloroplastic [Andrographis paniculata]